MLNIEKVTIGETEYEVKELTIGVMIGILPRLSSDDASDAQLDMLKASVYKDGVLLGDAVADLGVSTYLPLLNTCLSVNNLGNE